MSRRYAIKTFGCQMNVHDSDRMEVVLRANGYEPSDDAETADLIVFNTCSVREKAEQKLRSEVGRYAPLKKRRPEVVICIAGCMAQQEGDKLLGEIPHADLIIGPDNIRELPGLVEAQRLGAPPTTRASFDIEEPYFLAARPEPGRAPVSAFVTTMKGCDERCSFCVVPYTRGPERYRSSREIVEECRSWVAAGSKEIVLLGQTVDSFRDPDLPPPASSDPDESQFPSLLRKIERDVPGLLRLRYTSPHPRHATESLALAHREVDALAHHIHLPVQSGSDRVLRRMIRRYNRAEYIERARRLLSARPDMTLSTDIIVGFPGETREDFEATITLVREVGFVSLFGFKYSPRPHTPARKLADDVPEEEKSERLVRLFEVAEEIGQQHLHALVGTTQCVLIEGKSKSARGELARVQGRTIRNEIVHIDVPESDRVQGALVSATIRRANRHSLVGELSPEESRELMRRPRVEASVDAKRALRVLQ